MLPPQTPVCEKTVLLLPCFGITAYTMTAAPATASSSSKPRGRRKPPSPNSVLDPAALRNALDDANVSIKPTHVTAFYHALHRQGYPSLADFCNNYDEAEHSINGDCVSPQIPLRNKVTMKQNRHHKVRLPKAFLHFLSTTTTLVTLTSKVLQQQTSSDGTTTKLAIELQDGNVVESVLMRYANPYTSSGGRASLCVSSQVGCAMGCTFCATGTMGLFGNLTTGEILEQIVHADKILAKEQRNVVTSNDENYDKLNAKNPLQSSGHAFVRNVVFMGMGEPLDNFSNVTAACRALIHPKRWNLAHHCVTVSTVGIVSQIRKLTAELPQVSLALSLHAPNQAARQAIVPTASRYPIEQLVDALDNHMTSYQHKRHSDGSLMLDAQGQAAPREQLKRRAMIEYVMLEGTSSTLECAHELGQLCQGRSLIVNLIPYNSTNVKDQLRCPSEEHMQEFRRIVTTYGVFCTIRRTMGADIDSACGQLVQAVIDKRQEHAHENATTTTTNEVVDIEDVVGRTATGSSKAPSTRTSIAATSPVDMTTTTAADGHPKHWTITSLDLEPWIVPLQVASAVSASCFLWSLAHYWRPRT